MTNPVEVDLITYTLDNSRYGMRLQDAFEAQYILPESVVRLDCPDCGKPTTYDAAQGGFERCECGDTFLCPVDIATDLPWFVGTDGALRMAEVAYGECRNTEIPEFYGLECGNPLARDDAMTGRAECWACR